MEQPKKVKFQVLPQFAGLYKPSRYKVLIGGRGSGKSVAVCQWLSYVANNYKAKILCLRQFQNSIADSSYAQIEEVTESIGIHDDFLWRDTEIIHKRTQSSFHFRGLARNLNSIKSFTGSHIAWIEEAQDTTEEALEILIPTIRKNGSEIVFTFNPRTLADAVYQRFVVNTPDNCWLSRSNYLDNPFASDAMLTDAEHMRLTRPDLYRHVWMGEILSEDALRMVRSVTIDPGIQVMDNWVTICGIDLARDGGDRTVVMVRRGKKIVYHHWYGNMDIDRLAGIILDIDRRYKPQRINVDSTGHGAWAPDAVRAACGYSVNAINFSEKSTDPRYSNMRTQLYGMANDYFQAGGTIPKDMGNLEEELQASTFHYARDNRMEMDKKDEIKARIGRSPDHADAFVLTLLTDGDMITLPSARLAALNSRNAMQQLIAGAGFA